MERIKISVIMPVYKVEKYVGKAIESILSQTLSEFEFLIIDDGSPDKSGEICDEYAGKDQRIKVIHKENGGSSTARNMAIDMSKGKYLYFLDADDWAEPSMLEEMYELAEMNQAQLVIAGFYIDTYFSHETYITSNYIPTENKTYITKESFRKDAYRLFDKNLLYTPWNKLYLTDYLKENKCYFPKMLWDDFPFNLNVIQNIERVAITTQQYYHFLRARSESETAKYIPEVYEKREEEHSWMLRLYNYWNIHDTNSKEMIARRYLDRLIGCFENLTNKNCTLDRKSLKEAALIMLNNKRLSKCLKYAKPNSLYLKVLYLSLKVKNYSLIIFEARLITFVKNKMPQFFCYLKAGR